MNPSQEIKRNNRTHDGVITANFENQDEYLGKSNIIFKNLQICNEDNKCVKLDEIAAEMPNKALLIQQIADAYNHALKKVQNNNSPIKSDDPQAKLADEDKNKDRDEFVNYCIEFYKNYNEFYKKEEAIARKIFTIIRKYSERLIKYYKGEKPISVEDLQLILEWYSKNKEIIENTSLCAKLFPCFKTAEQAKTEQRIKVKSHIEEILASSNQPVNNENQAQNNENAMAESKWQDFTKNQQNQQPDIGVSNSRP